MSLNSTEKVETNLHQLELTIDAEAFNAELGKIFAKEGKKIQLPGFRKGKAPRAIIEKFYGAEMFYDDAINHLFPDYAAQAIEEAGLEAVDHPHDVEVVSASKEDGVVVTMKVTVKPEVTVGEYKGLKAKKAAVVVEEQEIDEEINKLRERNARLVSVEDRPAQEGDSVNLDFEGFLDGVAFEGGKGENHELELGSHSFIPGFEEQVAGHSVGEEFDISVTFPEEYNAEHLQGKDVIFKIKIHGIKVKEYDTVDDEFAKDVSEYDSLAELKDGIRKEKTETKEKEVQDDIENQLIDQIVDSLEGEIPEVMYENRIDENVRDFDNRMRSQGLNVETYLQYTGSDMPSFRKSFREVAERQVKIRLALEKIVKLENIVPTEEEVEAELTKLSEAYKMDAEEIKKVIALEDLKQDLAVQKAVDLVKDTAVLEEQAAPAAEEAPQE